MLLAVLLGLLAGFLFAASAVLQQRAARRTATQPRDTPRPPGRRIVRPLLALTRKLLRSRMWIAGYLANLLGFFMQALALHVGSVALVQPLLVTQLLFALPLAAAWVRRWPTGLDWLGAGAITAGLVVFLAVRGVVPPAGAADRYRVILAHLVTAALIALLIALAPGRRPLVQSTMIAVAAGLCFALTAVLIKLTLDDLIQRGVSATAMDWPGYTLAVVTFTGLLLEQGAFAVGSLPAAVAAMTITNPIAGYLAGVLAFRVMPPSSPGALAAVAASGALLIAGSIALANSPNVHPDALISGVRDVRRGYPEPAESTSS
jgi:drug/metabolite transporter (DMT)-like permease